MIIRSKAPVRISFAGGGTDVSPYCEEYGGCAVNVTLNKYAWGTLDTSCDGLVLESDDFSKRLEFASIEDMKYDGHLDLLKSVVKHFSEDVSTGCEMFLRSQVPPKSGLGSSASAFTAAIGLFNYLKDTKALTDYEIAELAYMLERKELKNAGGRQDQYAAVFGGLNFMEFKGNDFVKVNPLKLKKDHVLELEKGLVVARIGERKDSGDILQDQISRVKSKSGTLDALHETKALAEEVKSALSQGNFNRFGELLDLSWEQKKKFSPLVTNERIDALYALAKKNGALGGKVAGAGGGGHMFFFCESNKEQIVERSLKDVGAHIVNFSFDFDGLQTWEVHD